MRSAIRTWRIVLTSRGLSWLEVPLDTRNTISDGGTKLKHWLSKKGAGRPYDESSCLGDKTVNWWVRLKSYKQLTASRLKTYVATIFAFPGKYKTWHGS
jgi:hypothetical protein